MQQYLEELSVQQLIEKHSFVIPEIQREYVWGNNDYNILDKFFSDIKDGILEKATSETDLTRISVLEQMLEQSEPLEREAIIKMLEKYKKSMNIGFLYSYKPDYYLPGDRGEDAYLIDGQQRFTTLFLSLLYFSLKEPSNRADFLHIFRFNPKLDRVAFDYRVRSISHQFLMELISKCEYLDDLTSVAEKTWFLSGFAGDVTVKGMLSTLSKLHKEFGDEKQQYYQFIKRQIKFWHFKTEETSQGEELYITMNSRGQQLADNETIRARLFEAEQVKHSQISWGVKWEQWQDFFWRHREKDGNADFGLNQFLRWVNVIESLTKEEHRNREAAEKRYKKLITENTTLDYVTLADIEPYFNSLKLLMDLHEQYYFAGDHFKINFNPDWISNTPKQGDLIILLPALLFLTKKPSPDKLNRYLRFFSNVSRDIYIARNPDTFIVESIQLTKVFLEAGHTDVVSLLEFSSQFPRLMPGEEVWKLRQLGVAATKFDRQQIEEAFWTAEDFEINKGKIGHLIQSSLHTGNIVDFIFKKNLEYTTLGSIDTMRLSSVSDCYKEVFSNAASIWGDMLPTSVYSKQVDRLVEAGGWQLDDGFLQFVLRRHASGTIPLTQFCIQIEKEFLQNYEDEEKLRKEQDPAKQLYIYYILLSRIIVKWDWRDKWNIGIYPGAEYPHVNSLFTTRYVYQLYNTQWRYNVGYERGSGVWLQDNFDSQRTYLKELLTWAQP